MKVLLVLLVASVFCHELKYYENGMYQPVIPPDSLVVVDMYGRGSDGFTNGTGGGSGSFIRAILYSGDNFTVIISDESTQVLTQNTSLTACSGQGIFGGKYQIILGDGDEIVTSQNGNMGEHKECVGGRCNISPCLKGCQGRSLLQQIIPGSGGLAPYYISLNGTVLDNPDYNIDDRYTLYTTNLLNCCGPDSVKCATECVNGVQGSYGNGGSGAINFDGGCCDNICYDRTSCIPGLGGYGYVSISYEYNEPIDDENESLVICGTIFLVIAIFVFAVLFILYLLRIFFRHKIVQEPVVE